MEEFEKVLAGAPVRRRKVRRWWSRSGVDLVAVEGRRR